LEARGQFGAADGAAAPKESAGLLVRLTECLAQIAEHIGRFGWRGVA